MPQKLQPRIAVVVAAALIGERVRRGHRLYAVPAPAGAWLMAIPSRRRPEAVTDASPAVGAATLWAVGTVLGRLASVRISSRDITVLRFAIGCRRAPWRWPRPAGRWP